MAVAKAIGKTMYSGIFGVADNESFIRYLLFKMASFGVIKVTF